MASFPLTTAGNQVLVAMKASDKPHGKFGQESEHSIQWVYAGSSGECSWSKLKYAWLMWTTDPQGPIACITPSTTPHWSHLDGPGQHPEVLCNAIMALISPEFHDCGLKAIKLIKQGREWPNHILISNHDHPSSVVAKSLSTGLLHHIGTQGGTPCTTIYLWVWDPHKIQV